MQFADDIDAAVRRLERAGGLRLATAEGGITPELMKASQRRARELRAEALGNLFTALLRVPAAALRRNIDSAFKRRQRLAAEPTVWTVR